MRPLKDVPLEVRQAFKRVFYTDLANYWDFTGFDIVRFDDEYIKSGDNSMEDVVRERFGDNAVELIKDLLGRKEETNFTYPEVKQDKYFVTVYDNPTTDRVYHVEVKGTKIEFGGLDLFITHPFKDGKQVNRYWGVFEGYSGMAVVGLIDSSGKDNCIAKFLEDIKVLPNPENTLKRLIVNMTNKYGVSPRYKESNNE